MGRATKIAGISAPGTVSAGDLDRTLTFTSSGQLGVANALSGDLVANGGFETGDPLESWAAASGSISVSTSGPHSGTNSCQVSGASNGATQTVPFTWVGQAAAIRCWVKAASSGNAGLAKVYYEFKDKTGASLLNGSSPGLAASTTWQQIVLITGDAPANTTQLKLIFCWLTSSPTGNWFVDDCSCEELPGSNLGITVDSNGFLVLNEGQGLTQDSSGVYIANGALSNAFFAALSIAQTNLQNSAVVTSKIANGAVGTTQIANTAITNALIASAAVATANIQNAAITTALVANAAITNALIGSAAVGTANIQNAAITNALLGSASVGTANIQSLAVGTAQIANLSVGTAQIANLAITNAKINDLDVSKLNAGTINVSVTLNAATINSGSITSSTISGGTLSITTGGGHVMSMNGGSSGLLATSGSFIGYFRSDGCLVVDGSGSGALSSTTVAVGNISLPTSLSSTTGLKIVGTTVIDVSRNLSNIGTVSCGAITSSSTVTATGFNPTGHTGQTHNYAFRDSSGSPLQLWVDGSYVGNLQLQVVGGAIVGVV